MTLTHAQRRARRAEIAECVRGGITATDAAKQFCVTIHTVVNACREHGVRAVVERRLPLHVKTWDILADLLNTRLPEGEIAKKRRVTRQWVAQVRAHAERSGVVVPKREGGSA